MARPVRLSEGPRCVPKAGIRSVSYVPPGEYVGEKKGKKTFSSPGFPEQYSLFPFLPAD